MVPRMNSSMCNVIDAHALGLSLGNDLLTVGNVLFLYFAKAEFGKNGYNSALWMYGDGVVVLKASHCSTLPMVKRRFVLPNVPALLMLASI